MKDWPEKFLHFNPHLLSLHNFIDQFKDLAWIPNSIGNHLTDIYVAL